MSKDFDTALADALDHTAHLAQTAGATAARIRGRKRTMRKRIAISTMSLVLVAVGTTVAFKATSSTGGGTPRWEAGSPSATASASRTTLPTTGPTGSTATSPTGSPSKGATLSSSPGTSGSSIPSPPPTGTGSSEPFPGIWDITSWQEYRSMQAAVEQGHQPWLLDPSSVVSSWGSGPDGAPTVRQIATDTFQVTKAGTGAVYTIHVTCPDPNSAAPIWVITAISHS